MEPSRIEKRIKRAAQLIGGGLFVQLLSLTGIHPLAFVLFLAVGVPLMGAGILLYLLSLPQSSEADKLK